MKGRRSNNRKNNNKEVNAVEDQNNNQQVVAEQKAPLQQYGWALHHFFPDTVPSQRLPDYLVYPTHVFTTAFERNITIRSDGRFVIYWNPAITCQYAGSSKPSLAKDWAHYADSGYIVAPTANSLSYVVASDGTLPVGAPLPVPVLSEQMVVKYAASSTIPDSYFLRDFSKVSATAFAAVSTSETSFNRMRLLSAYLQISYTGKELDVSGLVKVGLNTLRAGNLFSSDAYNTPPVASANLSYVDINLVNTYPVYKVFKAEKTINVFYRIVDDTLFNFGPYDTSIDLPYYLVTGEGLPPGSTMFVRVVRTFEGVLKPSQNELCNPQTEASGIIGTKQHEVMSRMFKDLSPIISKEDYDMFKNNIFKE